MMHPFIQKPTASVHSGIENLNRLVNIASELDNLTETPVLNLPKNTSVESISDKKFPDYHNRIASIPYIGAARSLYMCGSTPMLGPRI